MLNIIKFIHRSFFVYLQPKLDFFAVNQIFCNKFKIIEIFFGALKTFFFVFFDSIELSFSGGSVVAAAGIMNHFEIQRFTLFYKRIFAFFCVWMKLLCCCLILATFLLFPAYKQIFIVSFEFTAKFLVNWNSLGGLFVVFLGRFKPQMLQNVSFRSIKCWFCVIFEFGAEKC